MNAHVKPPASRCPVCLPTYATTRAQLENRKRNLASMPGSQPHPCPACGSIEWATSEAMIRPEPEPRWWQFWRRGK